MTHHLNNFSEASNELKLIIPTAHRQSIARDVRPPRETRRDASRGEFAVAHRVDDLRWTRSGRNRSSEFGSFSEGFSFVSLEDERVGRETREPRGDEGDDARGEG